MRLESTPGYGKAAPPDGMTPAERLTRRLQRCVWQGPRAMALCPAHEDTNPSLSLRENEDGQLLIHCFAGCTPTDILAAVGIEFKDLWPYDPNWKPNGARASTRAAKDALSYARTVLAIVASDREQGLELSELDMELEKASRETLTKAGEAPPEVVEPYPTPPTVTEFLALEFEPVQPILGPFTSHQMVLLHAPAGVGKSMLAMAIGWHISMGRGFIGWECQGPHNVLLVDGEMAAHMQQERLSSGGSDCFRIANLAGWGADMEPLNIATEAGQTLVKWWIQTTKTRVLMLDNLMSLAWVDGVSVNSDEFWTPIRRFCTQLRAAGVLVIVIDHSNTQSGQIFGTKTKVWHADLVARLTAIEGDEPPPSLSHLPGTRPEFRLSWDKVRGGTTVQDLVVKIGPVSQPWMWQIAGDAMRSKAREMKENGLTIRDIAEQLGVSKSKVGRWLK